MDKNLSSLLKWSIEHSTAKPAPGSGDGAPTAATTSATSAAATPVPASATTTAVRAIEAPPEGSSTSWSSSTNVAADGSYHVSGSALSGQQHGSAEAATGARTATRGLDPALISALLGGPSDADLMRAAIEAINDPDPEVTLESRLIAFDNFEQLIESIDNANNLSALSLWTPLIKLLEHDEKDIRRMAAWSVGTAVQNNERSQERLLAIGGIPPLVGMVASGAQPADVKKKVLYALSSACRNYQPSLDACIDEMVKKGIKAEKGDNVDASDMEAVDGIIQLLREHNA